MELSSVRVGGGSDRAGECFLDPIDGGVVDGAVLRSSRSPGALLRGVVDGIVASGPIRQLAPRDPPRHRRTRTRARLLRGADHLPPTCSDVTATSPTSSTPAVRSPTTTLSSFSTTSPTGASPSPRCRSTNPCPRCDPNRRRDCCCAPNHDSRVRRELRGATTNGDVERAR